MSGHFNSSQIGSFKLDRLLGEGTFAKVYQSGDYAIKIVKNIEKYHQAAQVEISLLKEVDHPLIVKIINYFEFNRHICMIFPLYSLSLYDFMKSNKFRTFPHHQLVLISKQILRAVEYLHSLGICHTDMKPENLLLVSADSYEAAARPRRSSARYTGYKILKSAEIKLIDLGSAIKVKDKLYSTISTRHYRSPEVILKEGWGLKSDIWSIGCVLVELLTGSALFQTHDDQEHLALMNRVLGSHIPASFPSDSTSRESLRYVKSRPSLDQLILYYKDTKYTQLPEDFLMNYLSVIQCCLSVNQQHRPSATNILENCLFHQENEWTSESKEV
jgi:dual-specificity kinase